MNHNNLTPMNFQQLPHFFQQGTTPNSGNSSVLMKTNGLNKEPKCAQMTIFYDGKVFVFDDISAEKANDIMVFSTQHNNNNNYSYPSFVDRNSVQDHTQVPSTHTIYDLPLTRKASLYRFLEKRKDRIAARAPYQKSDPAPTLNKPTNESMLWLTLAPQSPQDHKSECSSTSIAY